MISKKENTLLTNDLYDMYKLRLKFTYKSLYIFIFL